jgi:hypothetical protein
MIRRRRIAGVSVLAAGLLMATRVLSQQPTGNGLQGIYGFREQSIGVPIFAALDGTVVDAHDGEDDMNTEWRGQPANYVILDNGGSQYSLYWHMRKNSVAVSPGQAVLAGAHRDAEG